jgi:cbb3-type cytochrome oxidase maturation protein
MSALFFLIGASLMAAIGFLIMFIWAVRRGQFEDTYTPGVRVLHDDIGPKPGKNSNDSSDR